MQSKKTSNDQEQIQSDPISCKFGQNPPLGLLDRLQKKLIFTALIVWWPWKLGQGRQNIIKSFNYPNDTMHEA